ncbi:MAG: hypothetical protein IPM47_14900 [Sphingobacteriales bacterium]|nr:MAG: hypothetical protein IPM47_14900 [Sphingobacteriales bacterium]
MKIILALLSIMLFLSCRKSTNLVSKDIECQFKLEAYRKLIYCERKQKRTTNGMYVVQPVYNRGCQSLDEYGYIENMEVPSLLLLDIVVQHKIIQNDTMFLYFEYYHEGYCVSPEFPDIYTQAAFVKNKLTLMFQGSIYFNKDNFDYSILKDYVANNRQFVNVWLRENINCR